LSPTDEVLFDSVLLRGFKGLRAFLLKLTVHPRRLHYLEILHRQIIIECQTLNILHRNPSHTNTHSFNSRSRSHTSSYGDSSHLQGSRTLAPHVSAPRASQGIVDAAPSQNPRPNNPRGRVSMARSFQGSLALSPTGTGLDRNFSNLGTGANRSNVGGISCQNTARQLPRPEESFVQARTGLPIPVQHAEATRQSGSVRPNQQPNPPQRNLRQPNMPALA